MCILFPIAYTGHSGDLPEAVKQLPYPRSSINLQVDKNPTCVGGGGGVGQLTWEINNVGAYDGQSPSPSLIPIDIIY